LESRHQKNAKKEDGVISIDGRTSSTGTATASTRSPYFTTWISTIMERAATYDDSLEFSNLNLPKLHDFLTQHSGLPLLYHSNALTANVSDLAWVLKSASGPPTKVEISAHSTHAHALESFRNSLLLYQAPVEDVLVVPTEALRKGGYCLVSPPECVYGQMSWVRGNIFAHIEGPQPVDSLHSAFIKSIDECFVSHKTTQAGLLTPQVTNIAAPSGVKKGEEFAVYASVVGSNKSRVNTGHNDVIVLLSEDQAQHEYRFRAEQTGNEVLQFMFAHPISAVVVTKEIEISVVK